MATIRARKRADGSMSYTAQIRLKKNGQQVHTESMTFSRKKAAEAWAKRRETELAEPGAIQRARHKGVQLSDIIDKYLEEVGRARLNRPGFPRHFPSSGNSAFQNLLALMEN